jgi:hypothetical protein
MKNCLKTLVATLFLALASLVYAQTPPGVTQIILFDYDGDEAALVARFEKRQALYAQINPEASMRLLYDEIHGSAVGRYRLHIDYPNVAYFSAAQGRERSSEEWQAGNSDRASTRVYEGLSRVVLDPLRPPVPDASSPAPGVVQVVLFHYDGDEAELIAQMKESQAIYAEINPEASMRLLYDEIHGGAVGRYRLHIYFPNISYFGQAQGRERMSEKWRAQAQTRGTKSHRTYEGLSRVVVTAGR